MKGKFQQMVQYLQPRTAANKLGERVNSIWAIEKIEISQNGLLLTLSDVEFGEKKYVAYGSLEELIKDCKVLKGMNEADEIKIFKVGAL